MAYVKRPKRTRRKVRNKSRQSRIGATSVHSSYSSYARARQERRSNRELENKKFTKFGHLNDYMNYGYQEILSWIKKQGMTIGDVQDENVVIVRQSTNGELVPSNNIEFVTPGEHEAMNAYPSCTETMTSGRSYTVYDDGQGNHTSCYHSYGALCHWTGPGTPTPDCHSGCDCYETWEGDGPGCHPMYA